MKKKPKSERDFTIRDLYPHYKEEQLKEIEKNIDKYLEMVIRMYENILANPERYAKFEALVATKKEKGDIPKPPFSNIRTRA